MGELSRLPNIGKEVERQLNEAGILSAEDLKNLGAEKAWLKIQKLDHPPAFTGSWPWRALCGALKSPCCRLKERMN